MPAEQAFLIGLCIGTAFGIALACVVLGWVIRGVDRELADTVEPPVSR